MPFTALLDACVLFPPTLRDVLLQTAKSEVYRARWTDKIHDEWIRAVLENNGSLTEENTLRIRKAMDEAIPDCLISGYEELIDSLSLPDPNDRHVLAAAIAGQADVIVTMNLKDFPNSVLSRYGIEAQHPDVFLMHQMTLAPLQMIKTISTVRKRMTRPPYTPEEYLAKLRKVGLVIFADELEKTKNIL